MDVYEATRVVLSRIQSLDPSNASKIMGLLLLQDHGEKEMIRLAFGPQTLVHSVIVKAKKELGLLGCSRPPWSALHGSDEFISPKNGGSTLNPASLPFYANGRSSGDLVDDFELEERLSFLDNANPGSDFTAHVHRRGSGCGSDDLGYEESDLGFGWGQCSYFVNGFCKNGGNCKFPHGSDHQYGGVDETLPGVGSPSRFEVMDKCNELLRSKSIPPRLAHQFTGGSRFPFSPKGVSLQQSEAQRAAALMMGDDLQKLGRWRPERIDLSAMACPASRQIYLTFPADSIFREEDVSSYFSTYGPVQDVRIPYQQKRMFGFVTFVYPETVKSILAKGNPHFVCDSRVLVKPYKEKGKVPDKYRTKPSPDGTPTALDSRDIMELQLGGRAFYDNAQDLLWRRKFEERALELQGRRLMNLQLLDVKKHFQHTSPTHIHSPNSFDQMLVSPRQDKSVSPLAVEKKQRECGEENEKGAGRERCDEDRINLPESLEDRLPDSPFASPTHHFLEFDEFAAAADTNDSGSSSPSFDNNDSTTTTTSDTTTTLSESFKSFNCQMPGLSMIGMLPGSGGPTCRVGI